MSHTPPPHEPPIGQQGWPPPPDSMPPRRRRRLGRLLLWLVAGVAGFVVLVTVVAVLADSGGKEPAKRPAATPAATTAAPTTDVETITPEPSATGDDQVGAIGKNTFTYEDGVEVSVTTARRHIFGSVATTPGPGVIVAVKIKAGKERLDVSLTQVALRYGEQGQEAESVYDESVNSFDGSVSPGRAASATYGFSLPRGEQKISVEVTPGFSYNSSTFEGTLR